MDLWSLVVCIAIFGAVVFSSRQKAAGIHRRVWKWVRWTFGTSIAALSVLAVVDQLWGRPWPSDPEIHPHDVLNGSSLRLPFTIKNKSIFPISNAEMTCGIDWVYFADEKGSRMNLVQVAFVNELISIGAGQTVNSVCDASELVRTDKDGTWTLRGLTGPGELRLFPPLNFKKMCVWMRGDYKISGLIPWYFTSVIFEWPSAPNALQWLEGTTYRHGAMNQDEWIPQRGRLPPDVVTCSSTPHRPSTVFNRDGTVTLMDKRIKLPQQ